MPRKRKYKGCDIVIETPSRRGAAYRPRAAGIEGPLTPLKINDKRIDVTVRGGKFTTSHLPYTNYDSVTDLAKAVIDHSPDFVADTPAKPKKAAKKKAKAAAKTKALAKKKAKAPVKAKTPAKKKAKTKTPAKRKTR